MPPPASTRPKPCLGRPGRTACANGYNEGCRCANCSAAKLEANRLTRLRTGRQARTRDGRVLAVCWCGDSTVLVHEELVGRETGSCGRPGCRSPVEPARFELRIDLRSLEVWRAEAERRGTTLAALIREAMRKQVAA